MTILALPDDHLAGYSELCNQFTDVVQSSVQCILVGESFSGPLAILLAHRHPYVVRHLVQVATFATSPIPHLAALVPWVSVFRLSLPAFVARRFLVGPDNDLVARLQNAVRVHRPRTLAHRLHLLSKLDVTSELQKLSRPITYIRPTHDTLVSNRHMKTMSQLNERLTIRQIDGPHLILQAQPRQAWQHIVETAPAALSQ